MRGVGGGPRWIGPRSWIEVTPRRRINLPDVDLTALPDIQDVVTDLISRFTISLLVDEILGHQDFGGSGLAGGVPTHGPLVRAVTRRKCFLEELVGAVLQGVNTLTLGNTVGGAIRCHCSRGVCRVGLKPLSTNIPARTTTEKHRTLPA